MVDRLLDPMQRGGLATAELTRLTDVVALGCTTPTCSPACCRSRRWGSRCCCRRGSVRRGRHEDERLGPACAGMTDKVVVKCEAASAHAVLLFPLFRLFLLPPICIVLVTPHLFPSPPRKRGPRLRHELVGQVSLILGSSCSMNWSFEIRRDFFIRFSRAMASGHRFMELGKDKPVDAIVLGEAIDLTSSVLPCSRAMSLVTPTYSVPFRSLARM